MSVLRFPIVSWFSPRWDSIAQGQRLFLLVG